jgi:hypothetical protein
VLAGPRAKLGWCGGQGLHSLRVGAVDGCQVCGELAARAGAIGGREIDRAVDILDHQAGRVQERACVVEQVWPGRGDA